MNLLDGKVCIITGSGSGIGRTTAKLFAKEGATIVVADFDKSSGQSTADEVKGMFVKTDVAIKEKCVNRQDPKQIRVCVLIPAGLPILSRTIPMAKPHPMDNKIFTKNDSHSKLEISKPSH